MSISKMAQLDTLGLSESTIKRKRRQLKETGLIKRQPGSGRKKIIDEEKECFILEHLAGNPFLSATKIATLLKAQFKDLEINEISIRRFLVQKGYKWKGPLLRVKNEVEQKAARLQFWKYNKYRNWNNVFFTDESSFYLRSPVINRWVPKNENNYVEKSKYTKKIHVWGAFWSKGVVKLKFFEGNMDSTKYIDILESSFDEMNSILPNGWILQWDNDSKHKSKDSLCFYIKNKIKLIKWPAYSPDLNPIENIWGNIKHYLGSRTFSSISSLKNEIEDKWNQIDHEFCRRLIDSVKRRTNIWISLEGALTGY